MDPVFKEEKENLAIIERRIQEVVDQYAREAEKLRVERRECAHYDYDDLETKKEITRRGDEAVEIVDQYKKYKDSPYFGRLDLENVNEKKTRNTYFIGKPGVKYDPFESGRFIVNDWRSHVGNIYYNKYSDKIEDLYGIKVLPILRRKLIIKDAALESYFNDYEKSGEMPAEEPVDGFQQIDHTQREAEVKTQIREEIIDDFLRSVLEDKRQDRELTDIIRTINVTQNAIIRKPIAETFVVQGCAGSGKTEVLLHRLSTLIYNNRSMDLSRVKIITPNRLFDSFVNGLSIGLELSSIQRCTVEEYYTYLIKQYPRGDEAALRFRSEKSLDPDLLTDIYSQDFAHFVQQHYHDYWKKVYSDIDIRRLERITRECGQNLPETHGHKYDELKNLQQILSELVYRIRRKEQLTGRLRARQERYDRQAAESAEAMAQGKQILEQTKTTLKDQFRNQKNDLEKNVQEVRNSLDSMRAQKDNIEQHRSQALRKARKELLRSPLKALMNDEKARSRYADYDQFISIHDAFSRRIASAFPQLLTEVAQSVSNLQKTPSGYGNRSRMAAQQEMQNKKIKFHDAVTKWMDQQFEPLRQLSELCKRLEQPSKEKTDLTNKINQENKHLDSLVSDLSDLNLCCAYMEATDEYREKNPLPDQLHKKFRDSLAPYETALESYQKLVRKNQIIEINKADLKDKQEYCQRDPVSLDDGPYLEHCLEMLKKLEFSNILNGVLYADLSSLYRKHGQTYREQANYRHTLYLKLLICESYYRPLRKTDFLVCIDEAQDLAIAEYELLQSVLKNGCAFNLYGDINQRIYPGREITDWLKIPGIKEKNVFYLNQNYRNTNQITEYCNQEFHTNITSIGISGEEVQELDLDHAAQWILTLREQKPDFRLAIIHPFRSAQVRKQLSALLDQDCLTWNSMETGKISVLTIEAAKGLEFEGVLALTDQMTPNEQYVAFTRALECLAVVKDPVVSKDKTAAKTISGASDETDQLSEFD